MIGAIETGGTTIRCARGTSVDALEVVELPTEGPGASLDRIEAWFADGPRVERVGVAAFGPLELDRRSPAWGRVLSSPKQDWSGFPLGAELRRRLRADVVLETDVNAAAVAEASVIDGSPVAYVTVGTGIGLGVALDGAPLHGLLHPEAGHLRVPRQGDDAFAGVCPQHGDCWEGLASGPAVAARWGADPATLPAGHPAWDLEARYLASGLLAIALVLSPVRVVLGGGIGCRPEVLAATAARLRRDLAPTIGDRVRDDHVVAPSFGDRSGLVGAFLLAAGR